MSLTGLGLPIKNNISLVLRSAQASYLKNFRNEDFLSQLNCFSIPGFTEGAFRMFEILGESMEPLLWEEEIVIADERKELTEIKPGSLLVLVADSGVVAKRILENNTENKFLVCGSQNPTFEAFSLKYEKIEEAWEIKAKISTKFLDQNFVNTTDYKLLLERVKNLEDLFRQHFK